MAAYEIPKTRWSGVCTETITRYRFVKPVADNTYAMADSGENVVGVSANDPQYSSTTQEVLNIYDGIVMVEAGEQLAVGTEVQSGTNGVAITYASGNKVGIVLTAAGASGELCTVKMYI